MFDNGEYQGNGRKEKGNGKVEWVTVLRRSGAYAPVFFPTLACGHHGNLLLSVPVRVPLYH